jgi:acyl-CoA synthetase (AMP-forming)/AMP-acid ligase II
VLHDFPGIHEAAVIGMPHELLGESPFAFVAPREAATFNVEVLQAFCRSRLPSHKMPSRFFVLGELPKIGAVGKVDKVGLRALAASNVSVRR